MALVKDVYSLEFYNRLADILQGVLPILEKENFIRDIFSTGFDCMEYKERMRHTTLVLHSYMPDDYPKTVKVLLKLTNELEKAAFEESLIAFMFLPDYIELYGIDDYETSVVAFERITCFISCEFAVRPFIIKYGEKMIKQMIAWSEHQHHAVRRLSSEGSRPRLPWAMGLPDLKKNPTPILPILENLKTDPDESVRRSVANNLNDIAKDNPQIVVAIATNWIGKTNETDKILKHACRTLLKQGHPDILKLYGLNSDAISADNLLIQDSQIKVGDSLTFSFEIKNGLDKEQDVRIEYAIYYMKANGKQSSKVFKISERTLKPREKTNIHRSHSFKLITTRMFHPGEHAVSVIVNGKETLKTAFLLY